MHDGPNQRNQEKKIIGQKKRDIWYSWRAYLVEESIADEIYAWAKKQDFMGGWIPEPNNTHTTFLYEFPNLLGYKSEWSSKEFPKWRNIRNKPREETEFRVMLTSENYMNEAHYDCSLSESININLPSKELFQGMGLNKSATPGEFIDQKGELAVFDPSVFERGTSCLLVDKQKMLKYLKENKLVLLWSVMGEKLVLSESRNDGRLIMGGAHLMKSDGLLIDSKHARYEKN